MSALLRRLPGLRAYLAVRAVAAVAGAGLVLTQALLVAAVLSGAVRRGYPALLTGPALPWLLAALAARALLNGWETGYAEAGVARLKEGLRTELTTRALRGAPGSDGSVTVLVSRGVDALDGYLGGTLGFAPALAVTPVAVIVAMAVVDWPSALLVAVTVPVVPLLLALVGLRTKASTARQWEVLLRLGGQFLEAVSGLATLRVLGRDRRTAERVREVAGEHRRLTMRTLRLAFLSTLALETITTVAVALVAVPVGIRLLDGAMLLPAALAVLLLAPEAYRPLRVWGAQFHAAQDGRAALREIEAVLGAAPAAAAPAFAISGPVEPGPVVLAGVAAGAPGRAEPVLSGIDLTLVPGRRYALIGPSGAGKTTLVRTLAGLIPPRSGTIRVGGHDLHRLPPDVRARWIGLVPQRPHLFAGTVAENVTLGLTGVSDDRVWAALEGAAAADLVRRLPGGLSAVLGEFGARLSAGERQRLALARVLVREPAIVLLDEPTARLDGETEQSVLSVLAAVPATSVVVVVTHRPAVLERADEVLRVADGTIRSAVVPA